MDACRDWDECLACQLEDGVSLCELGGAHRDDGMLGAAFRVRDLARDVDMQPRQSVGTPVVRRQACRRGLHHVIDLQVARMTNGFVVTVMATRMKLLLLASACHFMQRKAAENVTVPTMR